MLKRFYPAITAIFILLIFCNFQCADKIDCNPRRVTKTAGTTILPTPHKYYQAGDTITLNLVIPYTQLNDLDTSAYPIRRYKGSVSYEIYELTGGAPYNCKFGGEKFEAITTHGTLFFAGPGYSSQSFNCSFESDSAITKSFIFEIKFIPGQAGRFVIAGLVGNMYSQDQNTVPCNERYEIALTRQWNVSSRNPEVITEAGITGDLSCKYQNIESGFSIPRTDQRLFCFYVQ